MRKSIIFCFVVLFISFSCQEQKDNIVTPESSDISKVEFKFFKKKGNQKDFTIWNPYSSTFAKGEVIKISLDFSLCNCDTYSNGSHYNFELYRNGSFDQTIASNVPFLTAFDSDLGVDWTVPFLPYSTGYEIKVFDTSNNANNASRSITISGAVALSPTATIITYPSSGQQFQERDYITITWDQADISGSNVRLELYRAHNFYKSIISSTANDGSYYWRIPRKSNSESDYFQIKIIDLGNTSNVDYSNFFSIDQM